MERQTSTVQLRIDNTCEEAILEIQKFIKCGRISNRGREKPHHKDGSRLTISNHSEVLEMLEKMLPYLVVKKGASEEVIGYINGKSWRPWHRSRVYS